MKNLSIIIFFAFLGFSITLSAQTPNLLWAKQMGGTSGEGANSMAIDATGNVYTTGTFSGTADFNPSTDPNTGTYNIIANSFDVFVSKLDPFGNFVWAKKLGTGNGFSIAVDGNGNVYTTGRFTGTTDFDPGPGIYNLTSAGNTDVFISKLDAAGNFVWAKRIGGTSDDVGNSIAVNTIGNVSITGYFRNTADFDPGTGTYNLTAGYYDIFVSTLDASGNFLWAKRMGGGFNGNGNTGSHGNSIALDANGNIYITGFFSNIGDFDFGFNLTALGNTDVFVMKLDPSGGFVWAKQLGGPSSINSGNSIAVDISGNVYTTGIFNGTTDFNPSPFGTFNLTGFQGDVFVSKLDTNGDFIWAKQMGGPFPDEGNSVAFDADGNIYTTGTFWKEADFDPGVGIYTQTAVGNTNTDVFISKLDANGGFIWAKKLGGSSSDDGRSIVTDAYGNVHVTGFFYGTVDFDPNNGTNNLSSAGSSDIFVVKLCQISAPTVSGASTFCQGSSTTLMSSSASSYLWSNGATTQSISVTVAGNYSVTVTNSSGCSAASTITTVLSTPTPTVTVMTNNPTICAGQSATLTASGATSYLWSNGETTNSITVSPDATTTYTVTGTTADCSSLPVAVLVTVNPVPTIDLGGDVDLLEGQDTILHATGTNLTYVWSTGATTPTITVNTMGTYSVTVTNSVGCSAADAIDITIITSTSVPDNKYKISVTPNPTQDYVNITCEGSSTSLVQIIDNLGRVLAEDHTFALDGATRIISLEKMPSGTYYLRIVGHGFVRTVSIVKQ